MMHPSSRSRLCLVGFSLLVIALAALRLPATVSRAAQERASAGSVLAQVRYIYRGLGVQPPHRGIHPGRTRDPLYNQYGLFTQQNQKASVGFHDGTVLQLNQDTDAVLASHLTQVQRGEIAEYLAPGTDHQVQTSAAVASAIGTTFDVRTTGSASVFVVRHGALQVANPQGAVVVKTGRETTVTPGHAPLPPSPVDVNAVFAWTDGIPAPDLGEDVALDMSATASSERSSGAGIGSATYIDDGLLSTGWESALGKTTNQTVTIGLGGFYRISDIIIDPAATYGDPSSEDLKDFAIRVSSSLPADAAFTTVFQGTAKRRARLQHFHLPVPVRAKYVQLVAIDNYGSKRRVAVAEWEVVATASLFASPQGLAIDRQGYLYVADAGANRIDKVDGHGKIIAHWGSKGSGRGQLLDPGGVAIGPNGDVYVADTGNGRIVVFSPAGRFVRAWGAPGVEKRQFEFPHGIAVDSNGNVYITDVGVDPQNLSISTLRVQKFSAAGKLLATFDNLADPGRIPLGGGLALDRHNHLWLTNYGADTILEVSSTGKVLRTLGGPGMAAGKFDGPWAIAVDRGGNLYVVDQFNFRIERIGAGGSTQTWGTFGFGRGQYAEPGGVVTDSKGNVYVADSFSGRIQKLRAGNGKVEAVWGKYATIPTLLGRPSGIAVDPHGDVWVSDETNDRIQVRAPSGHVLAVLGYYGVPRNERNTQGLGQFWSPRGIAIASTGEVYVADTNNCRIQELAPRGPIGAVGGLACGTAPGRFAGPFAVAVDRSGNLYVADTYADRVVKLSPQGALIWNYVAAGTGPGGLNDPDGIAVDSRGNVYVANVGNLNTGQTDGRIVKLSPDGKLLATWGTADPLNESRFAAPEGLAIDGQDHLYVADAGHGAIQKLSTDGTLLAEYELPGNPNPTAVAVGPHGTIYVADGLNQRIIKLAPTGEILAIWT